MAFSHLSGSDYIPSLYYRYSHGSWNGHSNGNGNGITWTVAVTVTVVITVMVMVTVTVTVVSRLSHGTVTPQSRDGHASFTGRSCLCHGMVTMVSRRVSFYHVTSRWCHVTSRFLDSNVIFTLIKSQLKQTKYCSTWNYLNLLKMGQKEGLLFASYFRLDLLFF